ncbi:MAG: restriction endonuclease subunit S [Prevotella sp.]|nr:restriction endonuclease subunit S [Prevotella sp.]
MSEWKKVKLRDCCLKIGSGSTPKGGSTVYVESGTSFIRSQNVYNLSFDYNGLTHITEDAANKLNGVTIFNDDILLNITGDSVARTCIVPNDVLPARVNQHVAIVRADCKMINSRFLNYYLASPGMQAHMLSLAVGKGASRNAMTKQMIENFEVPCPSLSTQHHIATILSRYDSLIENYQKQIKLLEEAAQRLYKEWFVDLNFPGHENTKIVDGVPEGWKKKKVGEITPIKTGKKDANFGTVDGSYPFFTCSQEPIKAPSYSFDTSAVILAGNGDFNVKLYRGKFEAYQRTYVLEPTNEKMLYLLYFCISENMNRLATGASGSTIKFLTKGMIESLVINKPSTIVLDSFNQIIEPIRTQKENLQTQIRLLTEARDRLLPKLMSGEIKA